MGSPSASQELVAVDSHVEASRVRNTKVVENLMRHASPSVAAGVAMFGLGVAALPLLSGCRPAGDDNAAEAGELFTAEELRVRIGPLEPACVYEEMQLDVLDVVYRASSSSQQELQAEVKALQDWSNVTLPALSSLERRSALAYLGLDMDAEPEAVHRSYKQKALAVHPDKGGSEEDFLNLQEMVGRLQETDGNNEEKGKKNNLYETLREMMKRAKEKEGRRDSAQEQVPEEVRLQHRRTALHEQTLKFWERAKMAQTQLTEGCAAKSQNATILAQMHRLVDDLASSIETLPKDSAAATAAERLLCRMLRRGIDILAAASLVDATATVSYVALNFTVPLLSTTRASGPCPGLESRCQLLLRALVDVPAAFEGFMRKVEEGLENKAAAEWKGCDEGRRRATIAAASQSLREDVTEDRPQETHPTMPAAVLKPDAGESNPAGNVTDVPQELETYMSPEEQALQLQICYTDTKEWRCIRAFCVKNRFCVDFNRDADDERCTDPKCTFKHGCVICGEMAKGFRRQQLKYHGAWNCPSLPGWLSQHNSA